MLSTLLDNDILAKATAYSFLEELESALALRVDEFGVLGSAIFVLKPKRLAKAFDGGEQAHERLKEFASRVLTVEPSEEETILAVRLENLAVQNGLELDVGESQLAAITIFRELKILCTGDKRAVIALEKLLEHELQMAVLCGKVVCLEMLVLKLSQLRGHDFMREKVCSSTGNDKSVEICYQCHQTSVDHQEIEGCLFGYVRRLQDQAPSMCAPLHWLVSQ